MAEPVRHRLPTTNEAPRDARVFVAAQLRGALTVEQEQVAQLLVSELVTNAVRHADGKVIVVDVRAEDRVRVSVTDESPRMPQQRSPSLDEPGGRGLMIVDELAEAWGVDAVPGDGKRVWFELRGASA